LSKGQRGRRKTLEIDKVTTRSEVCGEPLPRTLTRPPAGEAVQVRREFVRVIDVPRPNSDRDGVEHDGVVHDHKASDHPRPLRDQLSLLLLGFPSLAHHGRG
jgi:hypothetical protein